MKVVSDKKEMIFRNEIKYKDENGVEQSKTLYKISLSHKNADGSYSQTSILCKFPKDTDLKTKTLIKLKQAWLDFYFRDRKKDNGESYKETIPYIFINEFEICDESNETTNSQPVQQDLKDLDLPDNYKTDYEDTEIVLTDNDLPF